MVPQSEKVSLSGEKETLLITVYGKAEESRLPDSLLKDHFAAEAVSRIDYDFSKLKVGRDDMIGLAMRAYILDGWTRDFITRHANAVILHLGCGLDTRLFRIDPPETCRWFDVDYPEVVALRRQLYPECKTCTMIGSSVLEPQWLNEVPGDRPAMIVAEGLLPYLDAEEVPRLLARLTAHFPSGELAFDGYSSLGVRLLKYHHSIQATGASLRWGLNDARELEAQVPRLQLIAELTAHDMTQIARLSPPARMMSWLLATVPFLGRIGRLLHYRFG